VNTTAKRYARQRRSAGNPRKKRILAVVATLGVFGALIAVTQVSLAGTNGKRNRGAPCSPAATAPANPSADPSASGAAPAPGSSASAAPQNGANPTGQPYKDRGGAWQHPGDGQAPNDGRIRTKQRGCNSSSSAPTTPAGNNGGGNNGGLDVLANSCDGSKLQPHDGFQNGDRCVSTEFGEVGNAANNPTLAISQAPRSVRANQAFTLKVSTRNLVRDRFLGAAAGGYYKESSLLNEQGLVRGHFHTACRMLNGQGAQTPDAVPAFFVATEDGKGGAQPDEVTVTIPGLPAAGLAQCAVWAGDGSHRVPMMQKANQIPAFDVVRITVR
jgi:hypothetical protein